MAIVFLMALSALLCSPALGGSTTATTSLLNTHTSNILQPWGVHYSHYILTENTRTHTHQHREEEKDSLFKDQRFF